MDEITIPRVVDLPETSNINDLLTQRVAKDPHATLADRPSVTGWEPVSVSAFDAQVVAVAKGLVAKGVQPGDPVGIMSRTRYEWTLLDFAAWAAGAVPVPIYETSSAEQVEWILTDAGVTLLVVETTAHAATVEEVRASAPTLREVLVIDEGAIKALAAAGADVSDDEIERR